MNSKRKMQGIIGIIAIVLFSIMGCTAKQGVIAEENLEKKNLSEFVPILEGYRNGVLANHYGEGLRTQIMTFSFAEGNRVYFCTTNDKPLYTQLLVNPYVSYCTFPEDFEPVLSLNGKVVFVEDRALIEQALETNYYAKRNFQNADNPLLRVFYIDVDIIETYSFEGVRIYAAAK
ncbi:pyridoxamine 5-phosphate oxidase [Brucepastera parasyntrophica]|uniref:pyridoxamine 5-phosphate oxidase n=1 Tax=Brucepastera parasyntrophica TaxID=2880008 RepID=UPI00210F1F2C|nr:pyridoxamine 5-phosphate oxidase [Brucepastera parasyntrophica]ULQ61009.1 pyridoxamine 5-phosphate oxidase [Brucepastera parasyntrophica]